MHCLVEPLSIYRNVQLQLAFLTVSGDDFVRLDDVIYDLFHGGIRHANIRICSSIIDGDSSCLRIMQCGAWEDDIVHKALLLIPLLRRQHEIGGTIFYF
ncbi:hypothetical protein D3C76_1716250 [compost metagenome]